MRLHAEPLLYGLPALLVALLSPWLAPTVLLAVAIGGGIGVQLLRRSRDKNSAALRASRRPLADSLWAYAGTTTHDPALASGVASIAAEQGLAPVVVLLEFEDALERLHGHAVAGDLSLAVDFPLPEPGNPLTETLRRGRPVRTADAGAGHSDLDGFLASAAPELEENVRWVVLPLLDPAPASACMDGGCLHTSSCPARVDAPGHDPNDWRGVCRGCSLDPVRGLLGFALGPGVETADLADLLELLARTVGTILSLQRLGDRLASAEAGRQQLLDAMLNGLISTDGEGRVRFLNRRARELLASDEVQGKRLDELITLPAGSTAVTRALMEGRATLRAEGLLHRTVGDPPSVPVRVNLTPLVAPDASISGAVCVVEDRSHVHALEHEVRHLDNLAAMGRFASGMAHEMRNPLGGIRAGVEYLDQSREFSDETRKHLRVIQGEVDRVDTILTELLQVARPRELVATPVDPIELAQSVLNGFRNLASTLGVDLKLVVPAQSDPVYADEQMIRQVLVNLVKNAIEASPPGEVVALEVLAVEPGDASRARAGFAVLDRGSGLAPEVLTRLFEPFFTRKSGGTGLGLYVSHGFVERHGGRLRAENRPGGGSRFSVDLPRVAALVGG